MKRVRKIPFASALVVLLLAVVASSETVRSYFLYDLGDESVAAVVLENHEYYEVDVAGSRGALWFTWLEFVPGQGDHLWLGQRRGDEWVMKKRITAAPGSFASPRIVVDSGGRLWLSYEAESDGQWDLFCLRWTPGGEIPDPLRLSRSDGPDIRHQSAVDSEGNLWVAWQSERNAHFDVVVRKVTAEGAHEPTVVSAPSTASDWHPDLTVAPDGDVHVVWDGYDGESYNVYLRSRRGGKWGEIVPVARSPAFEGRASLAAGVDGRVWILWEEGGGNWGKRYVPAMHKTSPREVRISDAHGPLHRFRRLRMAVVDSGGALGHLEDPLPNPSLARAARRTGIPDGVRALGAFYERGRLTVARGGGVWVFFRHYYVPGLGTENKSHQEAGWGVYARCLGADGWSKLYRFTVGQGDGMQSLAVTPFGDSVVAAWTTGRTDRRKNDRPRGVAIATIPATASVPGPVKTAPLPRYSESTAKGSHFDPGRPAAAEVGGKTYQLFFGDLHRHTDLSLCRVPSDGTIDDAYRYATDVARLDFLAITDHSRDIALGNPLSQLWWRSIKEVLRHELSPRFFPLYAFERSRGKEDHNVISLRADMLRPHTYPHPEFWKELDEDTFTIPHQTATMPIPEGGPQPLGLDVSTWKARDDAHRPLLEIYQGCRDRSIERDAHEGLAHGNLLGFVASSDHQSTAASYACVWAEKRSRVSFFRALKERRTFGATDKIRLVVTAAGHWMGEVFAAPSFPRVDIKVDGTAPIDAIDITIDGTIVATLTQSARAVECSYTPGALSQGRHYLYVVVRQSDGNRAWSSPLWVDVHSGNSEE